MTVFILFNDDRTLVGVGGEVLRAERGGVVLLAPETGGVVGLARGDGVLSAACCLLVDRWCSRLDTTLATQAATWSGGKS